MLSFGAKISSRFSFNYLYMGLFLLFGHSIFKPKLPAESDFSQKEMDFYDFYLHPTIAEIEQKRRKLLNKFRIKIYLWAIINIIIWIFIAPIFALLFGFITYPYIFYGLKNYQNEMKRHLIPKVLRYFGDDFFYDYEAKSVNLDDVYSYGIMPDCNKIIIEDHIIGKEAGVLYQLFELTMSNVTILSRKKTLEYPVFHGLCIVVEFSKKFKQRTIALPRGEYLNSKALVKSKLRRTRLEDPRFEKIFDIYGEDQIESRFIFTPTLMERLCKLKEELGARALKCSFYKQSLQIMLPTDYNHFAISTIFKPVDFVNEFYMMLREMRYIKSVVKYLNTRCTELDEKNSY